jgi:lipoprotein-releasing system ATP-binding protein
MNNQSHTLRLKGLSKSYEIAGEKVPVITSAELTVQRGEMVALVAPSGTGKSTILHMIGLLDTPCAGQIFLQEQEMSRASDDQRTEARLHEIGFVYQAHHLLAEFTALENVMLPQWEAGVLRKDAELRALDLLDRVGLSDQIRKRPSQMSGGQSQRVAIARAMANRPSLLLADEPTGNLAPKTSDMIFEMLKVIMKNDGMSALIATHNIELASRMDRIITIDEGCTVAML